MKKNPELGAIVANLAMIALLIWAAVDAFGWLHGLGIFAAVWLMTPYRYIKP